MRFLKSMAVLLFLSLAAAHGASANAVSYTGTLSNSTDVFSLVFTVGGAGSQTVSIQNVGFWRRSKCSRANDSGRRLRSLYRSFLRHGIRRDDSHRRDWQSFRYVGCA